MASSAGLAPPPFTIAPGLALPGPFFDDDEAGGEAEVADPPASTSSSLSTAVEPQALARTAQAARSSRYRRPIGGSAAAAAADLGTGIRTVPAGRAGLSERDGTATFMNRMGSVRMLSPDEEKLLSAVVQDYMRMNGAKEALEAQLGREPSTAEWMAALGCGGGEEAAFRQRLRRGHEAHRLFTLTNLRLVVAIAKKYTNKGVPLQDLVAEGMRGLMKGVERFDGSKGFKFSTYASWWVRQGITRAISDQSRIIRVPAHLYEMLTRVAKARDELVARLKRQPTSEELCEAAGISQDKLDDMNRYFSTPRSTDTAVGGDDDEGATVGEMIEDTRHSNMDVVFEEEHVFRKAQEMLLDGLSKRELAVVKMRYGLIGGSEMTLDEIGNAFGVTRERVRQLEQRALRKLELRAANNPELLSELETLLVDGKESKPAAQKTFGMRKS